MKPAASHAGAADAPNPIAELPAETGKALTPPPMSESERRSGSAVDMFTPAEYPLSITQFVAETVPPALTIAALPWLPQRMVLVIAGTAELSARMA